MATMQIFIVMARKLEAVIICTNRINSRNLMSTLQDYEDPS
jgi:hypothetical protein